MKKWKIDCLDAESTVVWKIIHFCFFSQGMHSWWLGKSETFVSKLSLAVLRSSFHGIHRITAFVMVVVHERVPDSKRYPPLPDIFLDNVPHINWAFWACEVTGAVLFAIWLCVLVFHRYRYVLQCFQVYLLIQTLYCFRMILLRRFFALGGTVFLLRCFTMLITSLSVPGTHLQCGASDYKFDDEDKWVCSDFDRRLFFL